jgi:glycosyltransferase involved in cell wall biosynthesis
VLSARGTDVNVIAQLPGPRQRILRAIEGSAAVIAVSAALKSALVQLGADPERITVLRNGVDTDLFYPEDRLTARTALGLPTDGARIAVSVGNLITDKRHDLLLDAAAKVDGLHVVIVGSGPEHAGLNRLARTLGVEQRVTLLEEMTQDQLRSAYAAADVLVHPSQREGWPNVLLESAACGTPVIAFDVGGVREIVVEPALGIVVREPHGVAPLANAIQTLLVDPPSRDAVRAAAKRFGWEPVLEAQLALYRRAIGWTTTPASTPRQAVVGA